MDSTCQGHGIPGEPIYLDGTPFTVVGVAPEGFQFAVDAPVVALWVTLAEDAEATHHRGARMLDVIGRLKPGISVERAGAEMDAIAAALAQEYPDSTGSIGGEVHCGAAEPAACVFRPKPIIDSGPNRSPPAGAERRGTTGRP